MSNLTPGPVYGPRTSTVLAVFGVLVLAAGVVGTLFGIATGT